LLQWVCAQRRARVFAMGLELFDVFSLSGPAMLGLFAVFGAATLSAAFLFLWAFHRSLDSKSTPIPVAPFFTAVTTVWALSFSFTAAEIWSANTQASHAASAERSALTRLAGMAHGDALDLPLVIDGLRAYKVAVETQEWGGSSNREPAIGADMAIQHIRLAIVSAAKDGALPVLIGKMASDFDELQDARNDRLAVGRGSYSVYKWYLVIFLTFLSQIAIASVHADRPRAGRRALAIYTTAATISLWLLALHANPYEGVSSLHYSAIHVPL
jgi:hypothetical protein